jgi:hypothetical protein
MRLLLMAASVLFLQGSALAAQRQLVISMLDINVEMRKGIPHLVNVSLDEAGQLRLQDQSLIPMVSGGYAGVIRTTLEDGSITAVFQIHQDAPVYAGVYTIVSGSGTYAGAHGQGTLATLTGYEAAASSTGIYQIRLEVTTPEHRIAAHE